MWFFEYAMALVFGTIGTIVGFVVVFAFIIPNSIFANWYGGNKVIEVKEKKSH